MPGSYSSGFYGDNYMPSTTYIGNNISLFMATDKKSGLELWRTDGTEAGTHLVKDINQSRTGPSFPGWLTPTTDNSKLFFTAGNLKYGYEMWTTDGFSPDAKLVKEIFPGDIFGYFPYPFDLLILTTPHIFLLLF